MFRRITDYGKLTALGIICIFLHKKLTILPLIFFLSGCSGGNPAPHPRATFINGDHLCFSTDKKELLNYYTVDASENGKIQTVVSSGDHLIEIKGDEAYVRANLHVSHAYIGSSDVLVVDGVVSASLRLNAQGWVFSNLTLSPVFRDGKVAL